MDKTLNYECHHGQGNNYHSIEPVGPEGPSPHWHQKEVLWPTPKQIRMGTANDLDYEHEEEMTSSELFFDLIFVVGIARLGEHARQREGISIEDGSYIEFFTCFFIVVPFDVLRHPVCSQ
jgi:hypothetical protein